MIRRWDNQGANAHWNTLTGNWWIQDGESWAQSEALPGEGDSISLGNQYGSFPSEGPDSATVFASIDIQDIGADYSLPATVCGGSVSYSGAGTLTVGGHVGDVTANYAGVSLAASASCGSVSCAGVFSAGSGCSFASVNAGGSGQCLVGTGATVASGATLRGDGWDIGSGAVFLGDMDVQCSDGQDPATSIASGWKVNNAAAGGNIALRGGNQGGLYVSAPHASQVKQFGNVSLNGGASTIDADDMGDIAVSGNFSVSGGGAGYAGPNVQELAPFTGTISTPGGTFTCASATGWEGTRNSDPGAAHVVAGTPDYKIAGQTYHPSYDPPAGGSAPRPRRF